MYIEPTLLKLHTMIDRSGIQIRSQPPDEREDLPQFSFSIPNPNPKSACPNPRPNFMSSVA